MKGRLHLAGPALATYPCAFRTIAVEALPAGQTRLAWQTHAAAAPETIARARQLLVENWTTGANLLRILWRSTPGCAWAAPSTSAAK